VLQLTTLLRSLGAAGATANARQVLEARRQEDWIVAALSARLDDVAPAVPATITAPVSAPHAA
jgi:hypothetical protein